MYGTRHEPRAWETAGSGEGAVLVSVDSHVGAPVGALSPVLSGEASDRVRPLRRSGGAAAYRGLAVPSVAREALAAGMTEAEFRSKAPPMASNDILLSVPGINHDVASRLTKMDEDCPCGM